MEVWAVVEELRTRPAAERSRIRARLDAARQAARAADVDLAALLRTAAPMHRDRDEAARLAAVETEPR
jgi:hypothetical protein